MDPGNWIALAGIAATSLISVVSLVLNARREKQRQIRDDQLHREQLAREDAIRETERPHAPHIEFGVECQFHGPVDGQYVAEFLLVAHNKGRVQHRFTRITLRVRGIAQDEVLTEWENHAPRLAFPVVVLDDVPVIPANYNFFFVEPGVQQVFTYVTKVPASLVYVLVHAEFEYDQYFPHTAERVFAVAAK